MGFRDDIVLRLLKNEAVLKVSGDCEVSLSTDPLDIENNKTNIYNWDGIIKSKLSNIIELLGRVRGGWYEEIPDLISLTIEYPRYETVFETCRLRIQDDPEYDRYVWDDLVNELEGGKDSTRQIADVELDIASFTDYICEMRELYRKISTFSSSFEFLNNIGLCERPKFLENLLDEPLSLLIKFSKDPYIDSTGDIKSDDAIRELKLSMGRFLESNKYGKEMLEAGVLEKNMMDGYDACFLSPTGKFYGLNGATSNLLHINIADTLVKDNDVDLISDKDRYLEKKGYLKIHHDGFTDVLLTVNIGAQLENKLIKSVNMPINFMMEKYTLGQNFQVINKKLHIG